MLPGRIRNVVLALCGAAFALAAQAAPSDATPITKVAPEFPREAQQAGVDEGRVKARMTLDGTGEVTRVEIIDAKPRRVFDRAVIKTLSQWKFNVGSAGRLVEVDVDFKQR